MNDIKLMNKAADNIRILAASMVEKAKSGHPGGAMGGADFVNVLFSEFLVYDPKNPAWEGRDRYFQDPGHMSPMLYSVLALAGKFTIDELKEFRQWGSVTPGHPEVNVMRGIENTEFRHLQSGGVDPRFARKLRRPHLRRRCCYRRQVPESTPG